MTGLDDLSEEAVRGWFRSKVWQALKFEIAEHVEFLRMELEDPHNDKFSGDFYRGQIAGMRNFLTTYSPWEEEKKDG